MLFEWLPSNHDNESPAFDEPVFLGFNFSFRNLGPSKTSIVLLSFLFPESVVLLRSTFRFKLKQLKHNFSDQSLLFDPEVKQDVVFACEKTSSENCLAAIPPYSPFCTTPKNVSTSLVEKRGWEALIQLKLDDLPLDYPITPHPQLQYAVLYGPCSVQLQTFGYKLAVQQRKDRCQLLLDPIWKKSICATPFENCRSTRVIQIPQIYSSAKYGVLICSFHKHVEFPHNRTMLQQLALAQVVELPVNLMQNTSNELKHDGEMRTFLAYGSILLILFGLLLITLIQKRRQRKPLAANMLQFLKADEWELEESDVVIHFVHKIGNGSTAEVYRGKLSKDFKTPANGPVVLNSEFLVAVKILKKNATEYQKSEFSSEMEINKIIGRHDRIVNLIGVMQLRRPPLIVFEYCPNGDLRRFLHKSRQYIWELQSKGYFLSEMDDVHAIPQVNEEFIFTLKRLVRLAIQICLGMEFLASRELIHADLATRNVFLTAKNSIKIGDFGMSRKVSDTSKLRSNAVLTDNRARWAAPEILQQDFQCLASDAWSFGVVLYELITLGAIPYHQVCNSSDLIKLLNDGERIKQARYCSDELYLTMKSCWAAAPEDRPNFSDLTSHLTEFYDSVDAKDNKANFYVMPDPDRSLYTLPLTKKDSPPNFIISQTQSTFGFGDSNPTTPKPSTSQFSFRGLNKHLGARNVPSNDVSAPKSGSETKVELIQETERLLGFS
uniref:Protein kinase domain-containing protein n=1 Tax=Panagrolaimus sp. JU765 TaxID=591449 RepID=A0AC34R7Q4_9BILA